MVQLGAFARRLADDGVVERSSLDGPFGFMAYHGGALEECTDVIATEAAQRAGASLYVVEHPGSEHIASTLVRREESTALDRFLDHVDVVVTVHGYGRWGMFTSLLLGGRNRALAAALAAVLTPALPDFEVVTELARIPRELRGQHADNPVNVPRQAGVQLELPPRVRGLGPRWADWRGPGPAPPVTALIEALAEVARSWPTGDGAARRAR